MAWHSVVLRVAKALYARKGVGGCVCRGMGQDKGEGRQGEVLTSGQKEREDCGEVSPVGCVPQRGLSAPCLC